MKGETIVKRDILIRVLLLSLLICCTLFVGSASADRCQQCVHLDEGYYACQGGYDIGWYRCIPPEEIGFYCQLSEQCWYQQR